jgi:hypothetical protein
MLRFPIQGVVLLLALSLALAGCGGEESATPTRTGSSDASPTAAAPNDVPAEFQSTYDDLRTRLEAARDTFSAQPAADVPPSLALELLVANGNRGEDLLQPATLDATRLFLDRFKGLGAKAVTVQIVYPLFDEGFPRHDEYVEFYRTVAQDVRQRGMLLLIETSAPFVGTQYSSLNVDYSGKTPEGYLQERLEQARAIAHELQPDYLSIAEEQVTERMLTGLDLSTEDYFEFLRAAPAAIEPPPGVKLGAGSGSWESPELIQRIIGETSLDYVDIHVYPLSNGFTDYLEVTSQWASAARAAGKQVVMGEAWLYKTSVEELQGGIAFQEVFGRDAYSFWQPLDALFMETAVELARASGIQVVSFFWSNYLFAYADYAQVSDLTGRELQQAANAAAAGAIVRGDLSDAGRAFQRLASGSSAGE